VMEAEARKAMEYWRREAQRKTRRSGWRDYLFHLRAVIWSH
jgi:hypothetical protein